MRRQVRVFEVKVKVGLQEEEEGNPDLGFANRKPSRTCYGLLGWIIPIDQSIFIKSLCFSHAGCCIRIDDWGHFRVTTKFEPHQI